MVDAVPAALAPPPAEKLSLLFDAHYERLYRLARRLTGSADLALDLVQETFLKAALRPAAIPAGRAAEEAWLVRVLVNLQRDQWRRAAVREKHGEHARRGTNGGAEAALIARADVWRALNALTPRRRAIVVLHELEGLSATGVAALLGITAITVRWHLSRARRELARILDAYVE